MKGSDYSLKGSARDRNILIFFTVFTLLGVPGVCFGQMAGSMDDGSLLAFKILKDSPYRVGPYRPPALDLGLGPLNFRLQSPGQSLRLSALHLLPESFKQGNTSLFMGVTWTNIWAQEPDYWLDFEMLDTHLAFSYCITDRINLAAAITHRNYFGGAMDGFIQGFHDVFGASQNGRDEVAKNRLNIELYDEQGNVVKKYDKNNADLDNTSAMLTAQVILFQGTKLLPALGVAGVINYGLNTPPSNDENDPVDYGLGVGLCKEWVKDWHTYHYVGITRYGQTELFGVEFEKKAIYAMNALAKHYGPHGSVILQYMYHEGVVKDFSGLSDASHELNLGFKYRLSGGGIFQIAFIENIITFNNSPDFGINLAYSYRW